MEETKINICSLGDPTNPKTWSGTPYNLYSELKNMNCLDTAFNSCAQGNKYKKRLINLFSKIYYLNSVNIARGFFERNMNSKKVITETGKSISKSTLHTGTLDLPFSKIPERQNHYLFCDSTWNLWSSHSMEMKGYTKRLLKDAERLEKKAYSQMKHIFPISEYVKNNLINHYGVDSRKITVVGTGLGVIKPYYGIKNYSNGKILFAAKGRFEDKGGSFVLKAFRKALQINPNLELNIVGQKTYVEKINEPGIKTYGFLPIEELQTLFNECSLFLMPAINEPWGLVYLEALACKTPIVGLNRNSFPEISREGTYGFGLDEINAEQLCKILINSFSNPSKLEKMGLQAQEYCLSTFSWKNTVEKIINKIGKE